MVVYTIKGTPAKPKRLNNWNDKHVLLPTSLLSYADELFVNSQKSYSQPYLFDWSEHFNSKCSLFRGMVSQYFW